MKRILIHNATIVNEGQSVKGSIVIEDGAHCRGTDQLETALRPL